MRDASAGTLHISVDRHDRAIVIRAEGEVDLGNADKLSAALRMAAAEEGADAVVLDLKALLLALADLDGRLNLVLSPGAPVGRLLDLAEVRDRFTIHESVEGAVGGSTEP